MALFEVVYDTGRLIRRTVLVSAKSGMQARIEAVKSEPTESVTIVHVEKRWDKVWLLHERRIAPRESTT